MNEEEKAQSRARVVDCGGEKILEEAHVVINGGTLSDPQSLTLRVAIGDFLARMRDPEALGSDEHGRNLAKAYARIANEIQDLIFAPAPSYRERLFVLWRETDARSGKCVAECSGAMKDLLLELGMEWNEVSGEYIFP